MYCKFKTVCLYLKIKKRLVTLIKLLQTPGGGNPIVKGCGCLLSLSGLLKDENCGIIICRMMRSLEMHRVVARHRLTKK